VASSNRLIIDEDSQDLFDDDFSRYGFNNGESPKKQKVWKEFGTQSRVTADASVQCNIPIELEKPKTFDACTQCCNIEIVTRKPAKIMSLDNLERKKNATHLRPEPATIPISNSTSLDDRLRSISKWMDNNEYSF